MMIVLNIFLVLLWVVLVVATFLAGAVWSYRYAVAADQTEVSVIEAAGGTLGRVLATLGAVSLLVGGPLTLMGFR